MLISALHNHFSFVFVTTSLLLPTRFSTCHCLVLGFNGKFLFFFLLLTDSVCRHHISVLTLLLAMKARHCGASTSSSKSYFSFLLYFTLPVLSRLHIAMPTPSLPWWHVNTSTSKFPFFLHTPRLNAHPLLATMACQHRHG